MISLILTDRAGVRIGELVGAKLDSVSWDLNAPGSGSISINPLSKAAAWIALNKTEIQVWIDGAYRHCLIPRAANGNSKLITFACEGIMSNLARRHINDSLTYGSLGPPVVYVDQFNMAWNLVAYAQTGTNMDLRITAAAFSPSGIGRLRKWDWFEHREVLSELQTFNEADNGFDFDIRLFGDGRREWTMYFPYKGTYHDHLVLEWGRNVIDYTYNENGQEQGNDVYATGGSSGDVKFEAHYQNAALADEYGVMEKIVSIGSELDVDWLYDRAVEEVGFFGEPVVLPDLIVKDIPAANGQPAIKLDGVIDTGDILPVRVSHGRCQMVGDYRIVKITRLASGRLQLSFNEYRPT